MKKMFLIAVVLMLTLVLRAKSISQQQIELAVNNFVNGQYNGFTVEATHSYNATRENSITVCNLKPTGFVVMTDDDRLAPILAYSFKNQLDFSKTAENPFFQIFAEDIAKRMEYYSKNPAASTINQSKWQDLVENSSRDYRPEQQWPQAGSTPTDGWVEATWNQSGVFNDMCPNDNSGERSVVGCVATAMAMIMDFHEYIGNPVFNNSDSFTSYGDNIHIDADAEEHDFPTFEELNGYLATAADHYNNGIELTGNDLAAVNFAAGISVEMMWNSDGSGAYTTDVAQALLSKFDYDSANVIENYGNSFYLALKENMQNMRPAEISIMTADYQNGHAIIVDGYNTDDYYHLNFGWGTSNNTCWYLLPEGMPNNYAIISSAIVNIEGGSVPIALSGTINLEGATAENTIITLEGHKTFQIISDDPSGSFTFDNVLTGDYAVTASKDGGAYYQFIENFTVTDTGIPLIINLGDFSSFTGTITADIPTTEANVSFFKNNEFIGSTEVDGEGNYDMPNIIPGLYKIVANLDGNYFAAAEYEIALDNQELDLELIEYSGDIATSFASYSDSKWQLIPDYQLSFGVKISEDLNHVSAGDIISKVRIKSPINTDQGEIKAQLWREDLLISEIDLDQYTDGEWIDVEFDLFAQVESGVDYYVGYHIISTTGYFAYQDLGPNVDGFGGFTRITGWNQINGDNNLCIEPIIISNNYGTISGNITWNSLDNIDLTNTIVRAGNVSTHPNMDGSYQLTIAPGIYDIIVETAGAVAQTQNIILSADENLTEIDLNLMANLDTNEDNTELSNTKLVDNYPNPFNPTTTIRFNLDQAQNVKLVIYNSKGQKVNTLVNSKLSSGNHSIVWDGKDINNKQVSNGIYIYQMKTNNYSASNKMLMLK